MVVAEALKKMSPGAWLNGLLVTFLIHFTYLALIILLVASGVGLPLPEDIPLITAGYLCSEHGPIAQANLEVDDSGAPAHKYRRRPDLYLMMAAGMVGVLLGDSVVFSIGRRGLDSNNLVARHLRKVLHSKRREKVERHFARHGNLTIIFGRFLPGFRGLIFAFAGMSKMSYSRFLALDGGAAVISVPLFIWLGYHFAANIAAVFEFINRVKHILIPAVILFIVGGLAIWLVRRRRARAARSLGHG